MAACAATTNVNEEERDNYFSLVLLLFRPGNRALRQHFRSQWQTATGTAWIDGLAFGNKLIYHGGLKLAKHEKAKVQQGDIEAWDLSVLTCVLMHSSLGLAPKGTPEYAELDKLRDTRNQLICHASDSKIKTAAFTPTWNDACNALKLFGVSQEEIDAVINDSRKPWKELFPLVQQCIENEKDILAALNKIVEQLRNLHDDHQEIKQELKDNKDELLKGQGEIKSDMNIRFEDLKEWISSAIKQIVKTGKMTKGEASSSLQLAECWIPAQAIANTHSSGGLPTGKEKGNTEIQHLQEEVHGNKHSYNHEQTYKMEQETKPLSFVVEIDNMELQVESKMEQDHIQELPNLGASVEIRETEMASHEVKESANGNNRVLEQETVQESRVSPRQAVSALHNPACRFVAALFQCLFTFITYLFLVLWKALVTRNAAFQQFSLHLKERYTSEYFAGPATPPWMSDALFNMIENSWQRVNRRENMTSVAKELLSTQDWFKPVMMKKSMLTPGVEEILSMHDLFKPSLFCLGEFTIRRLLVEGEAGMGKTMLCHRLVRDWSKGVITKESYFPEVEQVILLKCRHIQHGGIWQAIGDQLFPGTSTKEKKDVFSGIKKNQKKVLIILDGYDELLAENTAQDSCLDLITGRLLPSCYVIVTTRYDHEMDIRQHFDGVLELRAFSWSDTY